jgi:hypothetical protein
MKQLYNTKLTILCTIDAYPFALFCSNQLRFILCIKQMIEKENEPPCILNCCLLIRSSPFP